MGRKLARRVGELKWDPASKSWRSVPRRPLHEKIEEQRRDAYTDGLILGAIYGSGFTSLLLFILLAIGSYLA